MEGAWKVDLALEVCGDVVAPELALPLVRAEQPQELMLPLSATCMHIGR